MKGLILAGLSMIFVVGTCAVRLRLYRGDKEYKIFLGSLGAASLMYWFLFVMLPTNLGFLPRMLVEPAATVDFWNGVLVLVAVFHGFWVFTYVACLGPTMTIVVELSKRHNHGLTMEESLSLFGKEEPVNKILRRRLPKLIKGGYLVEESGFYRLSSRGIVAGKICIYAKRAIGNTR